MTQRDSYNCVYILKTGKNLYKIGKTRDLQKRLASYHTHLPILFRVIRQYPAENMSQLEESLHIVFQHKRIKGEWFELNPQDLIICDNIARHNALSGLHARTTEEPAPQNKVHHAAGPAHAPICTGNQQSVAPATVITDPLLQVIAANEKYLRDYSRVAEDIRLGLSVEEIVELHEGAISKSTIQTVRSLLHYQTPNASFLSQWFYIVNELQAGTPENEILEKYKGEVSRATLRMIKRILKNQLY